MNIIRPELKRLHSPDVFDLDHPLISQDEPFGILVQAMFGETNSEGEESFDIIVCNPRWIEQQVSEGPLDGRHHLIVSKFDADQIREFLVSRANECSGSTWDEVGEKLGRIGKWEFEDYVRPPVSG